MRYREIDSGIILSDWEAKEFLDTHSHEFYHGHIYYKFGLSPKIRIKIYRKRKGNEILFGTFGNCIVKYPIKYNHPKYYLKFVLIEFIQFIYDVLYDIRQFKFFRNLYHRLKQFYKSFSILIPKND